jgi:transcriptional regulator with XRE-family HTH domain
MTATEALIEEEDVTTTTNARSVGEALTLLRHRAKLTRDQLADQADVAKGTLSRYENDLTLKPDVRTLRRIAHVLATATGDDDAQVWHDLGDLILRAETITRVRAVADVSAVRDDSP